MAQLKVFVSSTCNDLVIVREQLRIFLENSGYIPIMSEYGDVLFDPSGHTHENCVEEITNADVVILIIGPRYGGTAIPDVIPTQEDLESYSNSDKLLEYCRGNKLSITQAEILKAIQNNIPIYTFIDSKVWHDHWVYQTNPKKRKISFPSIEKKGTAEYIFEFINFLRQRPKNNVVIEFSRFFDIEMLIKKQFSSLLQRLWREQKEKEREQSKKENEQSKKEKEQKIFERLSEKIDEIKSTMLATTPVELKATAQGTIKFRSLVNLLLSFKDEQIRTIMVENILISHWYRLHSPSVLYYAA